ncbi:Mycobacterium rhizamassiliense ORFan [Mycobacterium rhizamassiliense]|uniref:Mycobacterium rhizamassiliense ORFan n=1 Tax=Mycobacterium rhizamassiliense TaxID=1841860 RepID=A0A2U3P211_9MYCO|nr:Mycobacterium rhizamassiliense ORFan [Mycobacterium rhizamassiliense]
MRLVVIDGQKGLKTMGTHTKKTLKNTAAAIGVAAMVLLPTGCASAAGGAGGGGLIGGSSGGGGLGGVVGAVTGLLG